MTLAFLSKLQKLILRVLLKNIYLKHFPLLAMTLAHLLGNERIPQNKNFWSFEAIQLSTQF